MSNESNKTVKNDVFATVEETVEKQVKSVERSFPNYQTSVQAYSKNILKHFRTL